MNFLTISKTHPVIKSILIFFCLMFPSISNAQNIKPWEGYWKGDLSVSGMQLTLIFHVNPPTIEGNTTVYRSTLDVPMQRLKNFKIDETEIQGEEITWRLSLPAYFQGKRNAEGLLVGNWTQGGKSLPLTLRYSETLNSVKPQTPKPPYPYTSKAVDFSHPSGKLKFGGTLTYPDTNSVKIDAIAQSIYHLARKTPNPNHRFRRSAAPVSTPPIVAEFLDRVLPHRRHRTQFHIADQRHVQRHIVVPPTTASQPDHPAPSGRAALAARRDRPRPSAHPPPPAIPSSSSPARFRTHGRDAPATPLTDSLRGPPTPPALNAPGAFRRQT